MAYGLLKSIQLSPLNGVTTIRIATGLDSGRARVSSYEYLHTITLAVLIYNYCYGKSQVRITRDFLFVDLRKVLNSLTSGFLLVSCRYL